MITLDKRSAGSGFELFDSDCIPERLLIFFFLNCSRLGLLPLIFNKFVTELWPLIDVFTS